MSLRLALVGLPPPVGISQLQNCTKRVIVYPQSILGRHLYEHGNQSLINTGLVRAFCMFIHLTLLTIRFRLYQPNE